MIRVNQQAEPTNFDDLVRTPGRKFLRDRLNPSSKPTTQEFSSHDYWTKIIPDLRAAYGNICSYCCEYIPHTTGHKQVEHFWPKSESPHELAYEWSNYRLVCGLINGRKWTNTVLDPFKVEDGWFVMRFPSLQIVPAEASVLPATVTQKQIQDTIDILRLNDEGENIPSRKRHIELYYLFNSISFLTETAPFLAKELTRQNLLDEVKVMWSLNLFS
jgi:hypothetical protein